jgi:hypothetical protein
MAAVLPQMAPPERFVAGDFDPEFEFLLACTRGHAPSAGSLDWKRLVELAQDHGVVARVYETLSGKVGEAEIASLRRRYDSNLRKAMLLSRELLRICSAFDGCGIHVLPYKGPALACQLYGDVAARQFSDLDLLVRRVDVERAQAALAQLGYCQPRQFTRRQQAAYSRSGYEYNFDGAIGRNAVELKWAIVPRFYTINFDVDGFFENAVEIQIGGQTLRTLSREDALLVHCVHAAKHQWSELSWLADLGQMGRAWQLDLPAVQKHARRLGISRILHITFLLANELLEVPVPDFFGEDHTARRLGRQFAKTIRARNAYNPESVSYFRAALQSRERTADRARLLGRLMFTPGPGEWDALQLPDAMFPAYPMVRLARLARRFLF